MKIDIIQPSGYCFGVMNAINEAIKIKENYPFNNVYVLGELVHNEDVISFLNNHDIHTLVVNNNEEEILKKLNTNDILIFSAHGHNEKLDELLKNKNITFFDTTCKKVRKNLDLIKENIDKGIIYIGKENHAETKAAISISNKVILYDLDKGLDFSKITFKEPIIINQTTLSFLELNNIHKEILENIPKANIIDEICPVTRIRQENIINLKKDYDLLIIIGSKTSSNTSKLYELALKYHQNKKVLMIGSKKDLFNFDLSNYQHVAIFSGTSTPNEIINEVKQYLEEEYSL
ncbi:MAG: 4-hydroxy-3-methylbut-2-enyl diphosphate reductase [Candidatus Onthovivens sp.]|nr:4-hydroxy-3-methylbut-2-enyl diphosphate reductase [Candidatus Onthovivens sp.]